MNDEEILTRIMPEIFWRTSRSGGKGGQHVNKTESRVELLYSFVESAVFTDEEKLRLVQKLQTRYPNGIIRIVSQTSRSQHENKAEALDKLFALLKNALRVEKKRKPTKPSKASKRKKREEKSHKSQQKKLRSRKNWQHD
ncbi:MAG: alternative ribosome rescue aminoacyl-tRNA hydrolase ArfB [Flavobacteriales bacterium]